MFFAAPRWSPDGRWIVAERLRLGFVHSDIVLIDVQQRTCADSPICQGRSIVIAELDARWSRVMFSAAYEDQPFRVFAVDIASREMVNRLEGTGASAQAPVVSSGWADARLRRLHTCRLRSPFDSAWRCAMDSGAQHRAGVHRCGRTCGVR